MNWGKPDSIVEINCIMSWSLVVASLTLSHVTAIVLSAAEAEEASWSSEVGVCGGSWQRMPARRRCPGLLKGNWAVDSVVAATSSGSSILSGLVDPVGWRDKASAARCFTPGMWTILKR